MYKTTLIIVMALLCLNFNSRAQSQQTLPLPEKQAILGKVVSATTGEALPGAAIKIMTPNHTTISNDKGEFILTLSNGTYNISISHLSYKTKNISIQIPLKKQLVITLDTDDKNLKEVEIVSTGYQDIPKERATGSFITIDEKTINRNVGINILDRLEGVTSGLLLNRGLPTQVGANNPKISIRGRSTIFANAEPLIILDGIPYDGTLDQINPGDIEHINILKDAAASSIWGTRAGNGVIVITSKRGKRNQKLTVELNSTLTVSAKPNLFYTPIISSSDYVDIEQYLFNKGAYVGSFNTPYSYVSPAVEIFNQRKNKLISSIDSASKINALKAHDVRKDLDQYFNRVAVFQQHLLSLRGGSENHKYYMSGGYDKNLENSVSNSYNRVTLNANNTFSLFENRLEISGSLNFSTGTSLNVADTFRPSQPYDHLVDNLGNALAVANSDNLRLSYLDTAGNGKLLKWQYKPTEELNPNTITNRIQQKINVGVDYKIFPGLNLTGYYQYLKENSVREINYTIESYYTRNIINRFSSIINNEVIRGIPLGGIINKGESDFTSKTVRFQLNFNKNFAENHQINTIVGYEGSDNRNQSFGTILYGYDPATNTNGNNLISSTFDYPYYYEPGRKSRFQTAPTSGETIAILQSYYGNLSYSFKSKYILSASARRDESNLFGVKTNQKGVPLWSTGFAWVINKEQFYNLNWLPSLKLRVTYGYNGNVDKSISGLLTVLNLGFINEWNSPFSQITNPPNPLLRWEKVKTWNLGIDYSFHNTRISGSLDIYQKNAIDLIGNNPIAMQSGVTRFRGNGASLLSKGIDLIINSRNLIGRFNWTTSILFNYNTDIVTSYKIKQTGNGYLTTNNFSNPLEGYPYYAVFSFPSAGLDATGAPQGYLDGKISKDYAKIFSTFDPSQLRFHGSATPKYFGNIINTFNYKNLELFFNIAYKFDYFFRRTNAFSGSSFNGTIADYSKRWLKPGDELITRIPAFNYPEIPGSSTFFRSSEDVVERADHIRIHDIRIAYQLSKINATSSTLKMARIFLYSKNLGILWRENRHQIDPDYGVATGPQPFSLSMGINLNF